MTAQEAIAHFALSPHPEGGWYRETWVAPAPVGARPCGTAILFLLQAKERSHWHRVDATEIWHFHAGAPLVLRCAASANGPVLEMTLGTEFGAGAQPQGIIPPGYWQSAQSLGDWSLVGCTVSPGFQFEGFELAPKGFDIPAAP
jgi:uncharacterized protein